MELIWVKALAQGLQMLYGVKQAKPFLMSPLYSQLHINYLTLCVCVCVGGVLIVTLQSRCKSSKNKEMRFLVFRFFN